MDPPLTAAQQDQEERSSQDRRDRPYRQLATAEEGPRQCVAQHQERGAGQRGRWNQQAMVRAEAEPKQVRDDQPHESDDSADRYSRCGQQRGCGQDDPFDAFDRHPGMLRRFFAEGAFSQGFVPVMARYKENGDHAESRQLVDAVAGTLGLILFLVSLIGVVAAPLLVLMVAPGFIGEDGRFDLATAMLRFTFPYLFFVSLTAFAGGILNTYGKFAAPAFTPVILNVVLIASALWLSPQMDEPGMALAYGVFAAGIIQLLFQVPFLAKIHAVPRPRWRPKHPGVKRIGALMLPAIFVGSRQ